MESFPVQNAFPAPKRLHPILNQEWHVITCVGSEGRWLSEFLRRERYPCSVVDGVNYAPTMVLLQSFQGKQIASTSRQ